MSFDTTTTHGLLALHDLERMMFDEYQKEASGVSRLHTQRISPVRVAKARKQWLRVHDECMKVPDYQVRLRVALQERAREWRTATTKQRQTGAKGSSESDDTANRRSAG